MKIENCKLKIAKHKGFTLIELLVSIAIMGIVAAAIMINVGKNEDRDVRQEKDRLTSLLREVQNRALVVDKTGTNLAANQRLCGFGVHLAAAKTGDINLYYARTTGASPQDVKCEDVDNKFANGVAFDTLHLGNGVTADGFLDVFFLSPNGEVYKDGVIMDPADPTTFSNISLTKGSVTINPAVTIDAAGNIK